MLDGISRVNVNRLGMLRFKEAGGKYLLTNDSGDFTFLKKDIFNKFIRGTLDTSGRVYRNLSKRNFSYPELDKNELVDSFRLRNRFLWQGPSLHIIVATLRCNQKCTYCQASSHPIRATGLDMKISTAKKTVDQIFKTFSPVITIEFQGGEPLLNWEVVKYTINYARQKNNQHNKSLRISIVSNFSLLSDDKLKFLARQGVSLCTSLDGPREVHNQNRLSYGPKNKNYETTTYWINRVKNKYKKIYLNALVTVTKHSLNYPRQIIDEYVKWGFNQIHLRPLSYLGVSGINRETIGYTDKEFMDFYRKACDYLIHLNQAGKTKLTERLICIFLTKIFNKTDPGYLDIRSPCGAVTGQVLYNYNGKIYSCDEARMVGDDLFCIGSVSSGVRKGQHARAVSALTLSSLLDGLYCDYCVYKPYCGVCPVCNYASSGNIFSQLSVNQCKINKATLDYIFAKLRIPKVKKIFEKWVPKRGG